MRDGCALENDHFVAITISGQCYGDFVLLWLVVLQAKTFHVIECGIGGSGRVAPLWRYSGTIWEWNKVAEEMGFNTGFGVLFADV